MAKNTRRTASKVPGKVQEFGNKALIPPNYFDLGGGYGRVPSRRRVYPNGSPDLFLANLLKRCVGDDVMR